MKTAAIGIRGITLAFSLSMHVLLLGGLVLLAKEAPNNAERVYRVTLAEFAPAAATPVPAQAAPDVPAAPAMAERATPPLPPEPELQKLDVRPAMPAQPKLETKKISPKKNDKTTPREPVAPAPSPFSTAQTAPAPATPAAPATQTGAAGPQSRTVGGLNAYECDSLDQRPSITRRAELEYPTKARRMNIQGSARVRLVVDASGQPCNCEVVSASPVGYFEEAALKAARNMRFAPGKLKGQPVNSLVELPFIFRLR